METKDFLGGVAVGAVAGAIAALLLAPKSGKETRDEIKAHLEEIKHKIVTELEAAGDFTKAKYEAVVNAVVGQYEDAKQITAEEAADIRATLEEGFESVKATVCEQRNEEPMAT